MTTMCLIRSNGSCPPPDWPALAVPVITEISTVQTATRNNRLMPDPPLPPALATKHYAAKGPRSVKRRSTARTPRERPATRPPGELAAPGQLEARAGLVVGRGVHRDPCLRQVGDRQAGGAYAQQPDLRVHEQLGARPRLGDLVPRPHLRDLRACRAEPVDLVCSAPRRSATRESRL